MLNISIGNGSIPTFGPVDGIIFVVLQEQVCYRNSSTEELHTIISTIDNCNVIGRSTGTDSIKRNTVVLRFRGDLGTSTGNNQV